MRSKDYTEGFDVGRMGLSYDENQTKEWQEGWYAGQRSIPTCDGTCEPMCSWCNEQADIAAEAIANGEYVREY